MPSDHLTSHLIETPSDFPVDWVDPADSRMFWQQETLHFPNSVSPLDFSFNVQFMNLGFTKASQRYDIPIVIYDRHINTYVYTTIVPQGDAFQDLSMTSEQSEKKLQEAIDNLDHLWQHEWLPKIQMHLSYWENYDLSSASISDLLQHLIESEKRFMDIWELHFLLLLPMLLSINSFDEMYQDLFPEAEPLAAYELLKGFENYTLKSNQALWELSRQIMIDLTLYQAVTENHADDMICKLSETSEGRAFLNKLKSYLQKYGKRNNLYSLDSPSWIENPVPVIHKLKEYIMQPHRDIVAEYKEIALSREACIAQAQEHLQGYPKPVVVQFEHLLQTAQVAQVLNEDHNYWIDSQTCYYGRHIALEFGCRFVNAGILNNRDDIFYLTLNELKETAIDLTIDRRQLVQERRAMEDRFSSYNPPLTLGTLPLHPLPDNPVIRALLKVEGAPPTPLESPVESPKELGGNPGSPGTVRGRARVIETLAEAEKLEPGEILVTKTTTPSWTILFAKAAAVVTDYGGVLSHCAVVAREYGIPAVVGTGTATRMIQDGQFIEVDGNFGLVRFMPS